MEFTLNLKDVVTIDNFGRGYCLPVSFLHAFNYKKCKSENEKGGSRVSEKVLLNDVGTIMSCLKSDRNDGRIESAGFTLSADANSRISFWTAKFLETYCYSKEASDIPKTIGHEARLTEELLNIYVFMRTDVNLLLFHEVCS